MAACRPCQAWVPLWGGWTAWLPRAWGRTGVGFCLLVPRLLTSCEFRRAFEPASKVSNGLGRFVLGEIGCRRRRGRQRMRPTCIVQKNPQVPQTFRQVACHPVNNSKGKRRSIPQQKTRCDSLVPTLQGPWDPSQKRRGSLRFLRQLEVRPSSVAPDPAESRVLKLSNFSLRLLFPQI